MRYKLARSILREKIGFERFNGFSSLYGVVCVLCRFERIREQVCVLRNICVYNILGLHYRGDTYMLCKAAYCTKVFLLVEDLFVLKYRISHCRLIDRLYFLSHWNTMVLVCHKKESISFFISLCLPILYKKNL